MPVSTNKDTMLSSHMDNTLWYDPPSFYNNIDEDDFSIGFLELPDFKSLEFNCFNQFDAIQMDVSDHLQAPSSPIQMRHHDCMWSGTCVDKSHPIKKKGISLCPAGNNTQIESTIKVQVETINSPKFSAGTGKTIMTPSSIKTVVCKEKIPAGRSLLINSRVNTNTAPTKSNSTSINTKLSIDVSKDFDSMINSSLRPDTPLSLGDDPEFKHNIDLTPCPSSNRMKFSDPNSTKIIKMLREHLEEESDTVMPFLGNFSKGQRSTPSDLNDILTDITFLSDYEDLGDDSSNVDMDEDLDIDLEEFKSSKYTKTSPPPSTSSSRTVSHNHEFISDHSYTIPKGRYDPIALGVQTPSDSEEELDVVNISEKNLPTNPSARDRRALQTTVAHKIARSKQSNQRRRVSDDDSISSSTSTLSSKGSTPIKIGSQTPLRYVPASRKRKDGNNNMHDGYKKYRHGHKKQRLNHSRHQKPLDPDEQETIEKRNLHNNMERQRRIGLKNLFEELKCQIPSLKDKERAPKVNILREAASFCTKLRRDDELHADLVKKNNRLQARLRNLKASIAAQQRRNY